VAIALWIAALAAMIFVLRAATQLLIPIVVAVLISYALEPIVAWLERHRVARLLGAGLVVFAIVAGLAVTGYALRHDVGRAVEAIPQAIDRIRSMATSTLGVSVDGAVGASGSAGSPEGGWMQRLAGSTLAAAGHLTVVVFLVFFLLLAGGHFRDRVIEVAGSRTDRSTAAQIIDDISRQIQRFLLVTLFTATVVAIATWGALTAMNVQQAAVWGILAGILNSIPYFGPVIVSGGLLIVGMMQGGDPMLGVKLAGVSLVITSLEGWLLTPPLMGRAARMHVLVVFVGLLVWTWIWGAWGTILAVPMLVVVKSVADHVDALKPVSRLMAP
jgi:predicted PurR-regulated permease PerM